LDAGSIEAAWLCRWPLALVARGRLCLQTCVAYVVCWALASESESKAVFLLVGEAALCRCLVPVPWPWLRRP